jgi:hypothetical protein
MANALQIKESLIKQLQAKGANIEHFNSLVDDYIWYWKQEKKMQKDIKDRGFSFETTSANGYEITKENPSVKNAIAYNKQKLSILKELDLTTSNVINEGEDEL